MEDKTNNNNSALKWEDALATLPENLRALYDAHVNAMLAEIANNRKERDALKKEIQERLKKTKSLGKR